VGADYFGVGRSPAHGKAWARAAHRRDPRQGRGDDWRTARTGPPSGATRSLRGGPATLDLVKADSATTRPRWASGCSPACRRAPGEALLHRDVRRLRPHDRRSSSSGPQDKEPASELTHALELAAFKKGLLLLSCASRHPGGAAARADGLRPWTRASAYSTACSRLSAGGAALNRDPQARAEELLERTEGGGEPPGRRLLSCGLLSAGKTEAPSSSSARKRGNLFLFVILSGAARGAPRAGPRRAPRRRAAQAGLLAAARRGPAAAPQASPPRPWGARKPGNWGARSTSPARTNPFAPYYGSFDKMRGDPERGPSALLAGPVRRRTSRAPRAGRPRRIFSIHGGSSPAALDAHRTGPPAEPEGLMRGLAFGLAMTTRSRTSRSKRSFKNPRISSR